MEFEEVVRRSVRRFEPRCVEREKVERILAAAFMAPTSYNRRSWHFIVVDDREKLKALASSKLGAFGLATAPIAIVVTVNSKVDDIWIEDGAIAAEHIQLAAVNEGLASFWTQIRNRVKGDRSAEEYVKSLLDIPDEYSVLCIIGIGYPAERKAPHRGEIEWNKVSYNQFGIPFPDSCCVRCSK